MQSVLLQGTLDMHLVVSKIQRLWATLLLVLLVVVATVKLRRLRMATLTVKWVA
jgi:hypothetical protein